MWRPLLCILLAWSLPTAATDKDSSLFLAADSPHFQYTGRVAKNGSQALWDWPGVKVGTRLQCKGRCFGCGPDAMTIQVHLGVPMSKLSLDRIYEFAKYSVLVDGVEVASFTTNARSSVYDVALPAMSSDAHFIEVVKNSERITLPMYWSLVEGAPATAFNGITFPGTCAPLKPPARPTRRLEFIGDSITCGFGNSVQNMEQRVMCTMPSNWMHYETFADAIPSLAAKNFNAEIHTQCVSQVGITRNGATLKRTTAYNMSHYVHRTLPTLGGPLSQWDYSSWTPDIAVVNLGTNDYDISQIVHQQPSYADFEGNYTNFLNDYVSQYGGRLRTMLVVCGPMTKAQCPSVKKVAAAVDASTPSLNVKYVEVTVAQLKGCIFHPDKEGAQSVFQQLTQAISDATGWEVPKPVLMV